jgi:hypothetical protein
MLLALRAAIAKQRVEVSLQLQCERRMVKEQL